MKNIRWMLHGLIAVMLLCRAGAALAEVVALPVDDSSGLPVNEAYYQDATHYQDPSIQVSIETYPWEQTVCYVARITIANPTQLRTASAYGFNRKQVASVQDMANRMNAVLAINGDYSYYQLSTVGCYLLRQGQSYCQRLAPGRDLLVIDENGDFTILQSCTEETLAGYSAGAMVNTFNFGPGLVVNGQPLADNYRAMFNSSLTRNQRAAIAQVEKGKLEYICAVCEGDKESKDGGLTMKEWSDFMMTLGVENAYNLDGGGSSALYFNGTVVNNPTTNGRRIQERSASDIVYIGY